VLTALAVVNKPWGLLAVPVVLFALPAHRRHAILTIGAACAAILLPVMVLRHDGFSPAATGAVVGDIFNPPQLLWWFGPHALIARAARVEIVLLALVSGVVWPIRRSRNSGAPADGSDALLLLALVFLLRAALDPWNTLYYHVPFLFALMAYELRGGKMPVLTMAYSVVLLVVVSVDDAPRISPDFRATLYAIVTVPTIGWLASRLYLAAPVRRRLSLPLRLAQSRRSLKRYSAHR
jgi:hypothetical protein